MKKISLNIVFESQKIGKKLIYVASSPDINVIAEGKNIEEARKKFIKGAKIHLDQFPEEKNYLMREETEPADMPFLTRIFL